MSEPLIRIEQLVKAFGEAEAAITVLKGLSLEIGRGEMVALLGPSGSGKSTLLTILGTLMRPSAGSYRMLGVELAGAGDADRTAFRNSHIGFVFQFHHLLPDFTALENVVFPSAARRGRERGEDRKRAAMLLDRVGLAHRVDFLATKLSGGQKQRVAIARALMNRPELVLADEPTGNLDRESAAQVMDLLTEINREEHTTFLISTHDESIAARCQRQIRMVDGRIVSA